MKKIAIIAAHPDDEAIGCGATIIKAKEQGHEIHLLYMTDGISSRNNLSEEEHYTRKLQSNLVNELIHPKTFLNLDFPDNQMDKVSLLEIIKKIEDFLLEVKADIVITHTNSELNIDHQLTHRAVMTATRPGSLTFVKKVLGFEVASSTEWSLLNNYFQPTYFIDVTDFIEKKVNFLKCYNAELRKFPHPRSIENIKCLAQLRGASICVNYAEAFVVLRELSCEF